MKPYIILLVMIDPRVFLCAPIKFRDICTVYPPKVIDVVENDKIFQGYKLLTQSQEDIEDLIVELTGDSAPAQFPTPFEYLLINMYHNKEFCDIIEEAFAAFTKEQITIAYEQKLILFGSKEQLVKVNDLTQYRYLSNGNFFDFQNLIREAMGNSPITLTDPNEDPMVRAIRTKSRRRMKKAKSKKQGVSFSATLCAICCMGIGLTPLNIGEISYASVSLLVEMYQSKEKYQTDVESLMAGADPKKVKPKYWIRDKSDTVEVKI